jgi:hypothetical protein
MLRHVTACQGAQHFGKAWWLSLPEFNIHFNVDSAFVDGAVTLYRNVGQQSPSDRVQYYRITETSSAELVRLAASHKITTLSFLHGYEIWPGT